MACRGEEAVRAPSTRCRVVLLKVSIQNMNGLGGSLTKTSATHAHGAIISSRSRAITLLRVGGCQFRSELGITLYLCGILTWQRHVLHLIGPGAIICNTSLAASDSRLGSSQSQRTVILQEGPEGHLLLFLFGSYSRR